MRWRVEYYDGSVPLRSITSDESDWVSLPKEGVVFVFVFFNDGKPRTVRMIGADNYWIDGSTFGCWTDPDQPYAIPNRVGNMCRIKENLVENSILKGVPDVDPVLIKRGVLIPNFHAESLGLV